METHRCEYCGAEVDSVGLETVDGRMHSANSCREYVHAAMRSYARELTSLRAENARLLEALAPKASQLMSDVEFKFELSRSRAALHAVEDENARLREVLGMADAFLDAVYQSGDVPFRPADVTAYRAARAALDGKGGT